MDDAPREVEVSSITLRYRFNKGEYWDRAIRGDLINEIKRDGHPTMVGSTEPYCTRSQIVANYQPDGRRVAVVHQYVRVDGTLGGSGRPDPTLLVEGGVVYRVLES